MSRGPQALRPRLRGARMAAWTIPERARVPSGRYRCVRAQTFERPDPTIQRGPVRAGLSVYYPFCLKSDTPRIVGASLGCTRRSLVTRLFLQRQPGVLQHPPAAVEGDGLCVAHLPQVIGHQRGAEATAA